MEQAVVCSRGELGNISEASVFQERRTTSAKECPLPPPQNEK